MWCLWCGFWFMFYIDLFFRTLTQKFFVSHGIHGNAVASPASTIFIFRHEDKSTKKSPTNSTNIH